MGGPAIAETILGFRSPSGRLTTSFPQTVGQLPLYYNHMNTGRPSNDRSTGENENYTSKYLDIGFLPEYPFGFGLTYSKFEYSNPELSSDQLSMTGELIASAEVKNVGQVLATEVVQRYTRQMSASLTQPVRCFVASSELRSRPVKAAQFGSN